MILLRVTGLPQRGVRLLKFGPSLIQTASIMGRGTRGGPLTLPKPFPYEKKKFWFYHDYLDKTIIKVSQENAKIIVVEGPIGAGKSAFCKHLAEEFDMRYMPQPTMDAFYLLPSGYDLRQHDDELPEPIRSYDHKNFCTDPKNSKAGMFQIYMMYLRFFQYLHSICHLLNTGQGIVMERNYYSDFVFAKAMYEHKYISKPVYDAYLTISENTSNFFMAPHLIIYLDMPVPVVQERIRTRNYCHEQNSPALTKGYLESLEKYWKQEYLAKARAKSEILIYDWSDGGDVDVVVDDIEKIDFDIMRRDRKFTDWWLSRKLLYKLRLHFTNDPYSYTEFFAYPYHRVPELWYPRDLGLARDYLLMSLPECKYDEGYNYLMGESIWKIMLKSNMENHRHPKYHLVYADFKP